ncbi:MAG: Sec-independent protein translocase protein TatB [Azoarcus sp.]|jgi:sec-independent protein translocase protein TatB|nr:Sec-independent protein translocase protein TatB [Azoarcus sp.]
MFDLGFSELIVIAVVMLIVVGPERLPGVARTAGHLLGRMQRYISDVKADIRREMQVDELKKFQQQAQELEQSLRMGVGEIHSDVQEALSLPESKADAPSQETDEAKGIDDAVALAKPVDSA